MLAAGIEQWRMQQFDEDACIGSTSTHGKRSRTTLSLAAAPVDVGPILREQLFGKVPTVDHDQRHAGHRQASNRSIFSNAAWASRKPPRWRWAARLIMPSRPTLVICSTACPTRPPTAPRYERQVLDMIQRYVAASDGHAFVLFTSYEMMRRAADELAAWLAERDLALYSQADGLPRTPDARALQGQSAGRAAWAPIVSGRESTCRAMRLQTVIIPSCRSACPTGRCWRPGSRRSAPPAAIRSMITNCLKRC